MGPGHQSLLPFLWIAALTLTACSSSDNTGGSGNDASSGGDSTIADSSSNDTFSPPSDSSPPSDTGTRDTGTRGDSGMMGDAPSDGASGGYLQPCTMVGNPGDCMAGLECFNFPARGGDFCTKTCEMASDCPAPSPGCNGMGVCRVP